MGDGVKILIFSGAEPIPASAPIGTTLRFVAASTAEAAAVFPAAGVELRLMAPDGSVKHQRQFLPDGAFVALDMAVVRKIDGTAFLLCPAGGGGLPSSAKVMRLSFMFARDAGADLPVLRQAGDDSPETVSLDVSLVPAS